MTRSHVCFALAVALAVTAVLALQATGGPESPDEMLAAAKKVEQDFLAAFNGHDLDALMKLYWNSPDLVVFPPDVPGGTGHETAKRIFADMMKVEGAKLEITESHNRVAGEVVLGWGRWTFTFPGPDGKPMTMSGRYTDVKERKDGKWVYTSDHASAPLPSEEPSDEK